MVFDLLKYSLDDFGQQRQNALLRFYAGILDFLSKNSDNELLTNVDNFLSE